MSMLLLDDGAKAPSAANSARWFVLVLPALAAIAYPLMLRAISALHANGQISAPPGPAVIAVVAGGPGIRCRCDGGRVRAAPRLWDAKALDRPGACWPIWLSPGPTLLVAVGNVVGLFHARGVVAYAWPLFWLAVTVVVLLAQEIAPAVPAARQPAAGDRPWHFGVGDSGRLHSAASGQSSDGDRERRRPYWRDENRSPGLPQRHHRTFAAHFDRVPGHERLRPGAAQAHARERFFRHAPDHTGVYVGIYLLGHMMAAFAARGAGTDTNWNWLTSDDRGLLFFLSVFCSGRRITGWARSPSSPMSLAASGAWALAHGVSEPAAGRLPGD